MADATQPVGQDASLAGLIGRLRGGTPGGSPALLVLLVMLTAAFAVLIPGFASLGTLQSFMHQLPMLGAALARHDGAARSPAA